MVRLVKAAKGSEKPLLLELVHMIDTGGQPEFMEVLPCLVHHSNLADPWTVTIFFTFGPCPAQYKARVMIIPRIILTFSKRWVLPTIVL